MGQETSFGGEGAFAPLIFGENFFYYFKINMLFWHLSTLDTVLPKNVKYAIFSIYLH